MPQLIQIKQRMNAIEKTRKITCAMRLIAMSLYSKLEKQSVVLQHYTESCSAMITMLQEHGAHLSLYDIHATPAEKPLIILCSSNRSLCGSMNTAMLRYFMNTRSFGGTTPNTFITVGGHAARFLEKSDEETHVLHEAELTNATATALADRLTTKIFAERYTSVTIYYTHLKNFFVQTPTHITILPLEQNEQGPGAEKQSSAKKALWEQSIEQIAPTALRHYVYTSILHSLFNTIISENAARFIAMDQSTNNANSYLEALGLEYNKSRQSIITQEIAELASNLD